MFPASATPVDKISTRKELERVLREISKSPKQTQPAPCSRQPPAASKAAASNPITGALPVRYDFY